MSSRTRIRNVLHQRYSADRLAVGKEVQYLRPEIEYDDEKVGKANTRRDEADSDFQPSQESQEDSSSAYSSQHRTSDSDSYSSPQEEYYSQSQALDESCTPRKTARNLESTIEEPLFLDSSQPDEGFFFSSSQPLEQVQAKEESELEIIVKR
ncbi:hypothetical protein BDQ12DRAFT_768116 [Crucibulum laeve]|uniref:Uncharacterized protein n=1 Tax=Crucibulum laeve TaxID=68775 RepID=A0A5C3M9V1_9AGAR|nr:hypothetical protein BDQ12DRAFT_768116 [Crucibulum laeve]